MFYFIRGTCNILLIVAYFGIIHFNEETLFFVLNVGN